MLYDGLAIPLGDKSFDMTLLNCVLNRCDQPSDVLAEVIRVTRKRIVVIESIHLNETQRQFNMFFDWLFNEVLSQAGPGAHNFRKHDDWRRRAGSPSKWHSHPRLCRGIKKAWLQTPQPRHPAVSWHKKTVVANTATTAPGNHGTRLITDYLKNIRVSPFLFL